MHWRTVGQRAARPWKSWACAALGAAVGIGLAASRHAPAVRLLAEKPRLDVVFALDTTGSMDDELAVIKERLGAMSRNLEAEADVRFGLVAYRDRGDAYLSFPIPLTRDRAALEQSLARLQASGGGDTPEAVGEAVRCAIDEMNWDRSANCSRLLFLIGDAGPHQQDLSACFGAVRDARAAGIKVHAWGCSGLQDSGDDDFRQIAALGGGEFNYLTYGQSVQRADGSPARLLFQGSKTFEVAPDAEWRGGADQTDAKRPVSSVQVAAPGAGGAASYRSQDYRAKDLTLENNLDAVLTRQIEAEARSLP